MNKLLGHGRAEVIRAGIETAPSGRECLTCVVQFDERKFSNGTVYRQRVKVISYQPEIHSIVRKLARGTMVTFSGEVDALPEIGAGGKWFANPRVIGQLVVEEDYADA